MNTTIPTGTVIHGTLRNEDLIPRFLYTLKLYGPDRYEEIVNEIWPHLFTKEGELIPETWEQPNGEGEDWWTDNPDSAYLLLDLVESLEALASEGYYFGAHPGDGSDIGYWEVEDDEDETLQP